MVEYELWIDGKRADLGEEDLTLCYESPLFAELDAIVSNRSYNIELPLTQKNRSIIGNAQRVDVDSDAPYIKLPAELYANGIAVFTNGFAIIDNISDTISCSLVWGNIEALEQLFNTELSELSEVMERQGNGAIAWDDTMEWGTSTDAGGVKYISADFGLGVVLPQSDDATSMEYARPSVSIHAVLSAIEENGDVFLNLWDDYIGMPDLWLPLTRDRGDDSLPAFIGHLAWRSGDGAMLFLSSSVQDFAGILLSDSKLDFSRGKSVVSVEVSANGSAFQVLLSTGHDGFLNPILPDAVVFRIVGSKGGIDYNLAVKFGNYAGYTSTAQAAYKFDPILLEISKYDKVWFALDVKGIPYRGDIQNIGIYINGSFPGKKLIFPCNIPVAANLPNMSCGSFVQNLMNMYGLFATVNASSAKRVEFISVDHLYRALEEGDITDWSSLLLSNLQRGVSDAEEISYSIDGWAQQNYLRYKDDGANEQEYSFDDGVITIENRNLDKETETTIDFSASGTKYQQVYGGTASAMGEVAVIQLYAKDGERITKSNVGQRILLQSSTDDGLKDYLTFPPSLNFGGDEGLVASFYRGMQRVLNRAKVITVNMRLSMLELRNLNWGRPVFLRQYGAYFAIYRITLANTGISTVELIKL
uniref:hypothetical protein n=1 Tax=Alistipes sp. TaxID=1872444 RepID=UPI004055B4C2